MLPRMMNADQCTLFPTASSLQGSSGPSSVMLPVLQSLMKDTDTVTLLLALVPVEPETLY